MNSTKKDLVLICGGRSTEHEVSLASAYNIAKAVDKDKYNLFVVGIDKTGAWRQYDSENFVENPTDFKDLKLGQPISGRLAVIQCSNAFYDIENNSRIAFKADVIFPAILGNYAEDGTMQGLLRMMDVPFTTPDVLASAVGMDKEVTKRLLAQAGIKNAKFVLVRKNQARPEFEEVRKLLGDILFVKAANNGSSIGVYKVTDAEGFTEALEKAFRYDTKVLVEEAIVGREVELSVMGLIGDIQVSSAVGEITPKKAGEFYSYDTKYVNSDNAELIAPAEVSSQELETLQTLAIRTCEAIECEGFARVDFFIKEDGEVYVNEINTMPGFTNISMFPRLWAESGVSYPELVDRLIELAIERYNYRIKPIITDAEEVLRMETEG
jgi:D-alanine-D-alanine ligase